MSTSWENLVENKLTIYPNPVKEVLHINQEKSKTLEVQIFSITGQKIYQKEFSSENLIINLKGVAVGIYFLKIKEEKTGQLFLEKITKQ